MKKKITVEIDAKLHKKFVSALKKKGSNLTKRIGELIKGDLKV